MSIRPSAYAERAKLKSGMFSFDYAVGTQRVYGKTGVVAVDLSTGPLKHLIGWAERPYTTKTDGVVGPGGVPEGIARFVLRTAFLTERAVTLSMTDQGGLASGWGERYALIDLGGQPVPPRLDPYHARTLATARAAALIAVAQGGTLRGRVE